MPIYAYRCESCGFAKDVLQKRSDPVLEVCPSCGASTFKKQLTAPAFQLKGSGWYVTDFRDNGKDKAGADKQGGESSSADKPADGGAAASAGAPAGSTPAAPASTPAATPAPAPAPAAPSPPGGAKSA